MARGFRDYNSRGLSFKEQQSVKVYDLLSECFHRNANYRVYMCMCMYPNLNLYVYPMSTVAAPVLFFPFCEPF